MATMTIFKLDHFYVMPMTIDVDLPSSVIIKATNNAFIHMYENYKELPEIGVLICPDCKLQREAKEFIAPRQESIGRSYVWGVSDEGAYVKWCVVNTELHGHDDIDFPRLKFEDYFRPMEKYKGCITGEKYGI
jgi:hypothetical protein